MYRFGIMYRNSLLNRKNISIKTYKIQTPYEDRIDIFTKSNTLLEGEKLIDDLRQIKVSCQKLNKIWIRFS